MLTQLELEKLMELLIVNPEITLEVFFQMFTKQFCGEFQNLFRPCYICICLISENLITEQQRLAIIFLIIETYRADQKHNPFIPNLIEAILKLDDQFEAKLFAQLYSQTIQESKQFCKIELEKLMKDKDKHTYVTSTVYQDKIKDIKQKYMDNLPKSIMKYSFGLSNVLTDFNITEDFQNFPPNLSIQPEDIKLCDLGIMSFLPDCLRPIPNRVPLGCDEDGWINPGIVSDQLWDYTTFERTKVQEMLMKAYEGKLTEQESEVFKKELEQCKLNVFDIEINTDYLHKLVEYNTKIASYVLVKIGQERNLLKYLEKILSLELNIQSLELVHDLISKVDNLPKEFVYYYVSNIMHQCDQTKMDKNLRQKYVKLVIYFILHLIKSKSINPKEIFLELQCFAIENQCFPEASLLFKQLKELDGIDSTHSINNNNNNNSNHNNVH